MQLTHNRRAALERVDHLEIHSLDRNRDLGTGAVHREQAEQCCACPRPPIPHASNRRRFAIPTLSKVQSQFSDAWTWLESAMVMKARSARGVHLMLSLPPLPTTLPVEDRTTATRCQFSGRLGDALDVAYQKRESTPR